MKLKRRVFAAWVSVAEPLVFATQKRMGDLKNVCERCLTPEFSRSAEGVICWNELLGVNGGTDV